MRNPGAWVKHAELNAGLRGDGLVTAEREELRRLRREVRILREEREILKPPREVTDFTGTPVEAAAFFARLEKTVQAVEAFGQVGAGEGPPRGSANVPGIEGLPQRVLRVARSQVESAECWSGSGAVEEGSTGTYGACSGMGGAAGVWGTVRAQAAERG